MWKKLLGVGVALLVLSLVHSALAQQMGAWTFDEGSGTTAKDSSGNNNNGRLVGGPTWVPGKFGKALKFDGVDDYVEVPHNASLLPPGNEETVSVWINAERLTGPNGAQWQGILSKGDSPRVYSLYTDSGGGVLHFSTGPSGAYVGTVSTTQVPLNQWVHIAVVVTGGQHHYYINGLPAGVSGSGVTLPAGSTSILTIGKTPGETDREFKGMIDDVRLFDFAMTAEEIKDLYDGKVPVWPKAKKPDPADGAMGVTMPLLQWNAGQGALFHDVYVGTSPDLTAADLKSPHQPFAMYYHALGLEPGVTYYWRIDETAGDGTVTAGDVWSFTAAPTTAYTPSPRNGDKWIATDAALTWLMGQGAISHEVYFGTDKDAVANRDAGALKSTQPAATYAPGALNQNTTYYWAVDETTMAGTEYAGEVWSFTTIGPGGGVKGEYFNGMTPGGVPALTRIDPAIDFSWGDPGGPGAPIGVDTFSARWTADLEIAVADTYTFITSTDDGVRLWLNDEQIINQWVDQGTTDVFSQPIALKPGVYSLRMEYYENTGGAVAQLSWQTPTVARQIIPGGPLQPPVRARALYPADGDVNIPQDVTLMWSAGERAVQHQIYFGEDKETVANATPDSADIYKGKQAVDATSFSPGTLEWNKTYYWRVDEVNDASADSPWKGVVWSFTTADFIVVDDFESYNDEVDKGTRIYETWIDGLTNQTTSTVGNWDPPFAEQTIVHSGKQSMPMDYNNINSPFYAEAEREFSPVQNWKVNDVTDLTLFVRGNAARLVEDPPGQYTISANSVDVWGTADNFRFVYKTLNGDGSISAKVISMTDTTSTWAKAGVMIRESLSADSSYAFMFPTPDGRRAYQNRPSAAANAVSAHSATGLVTLPFWVKVERKGSQFTAYYSTDGKNWTKQPDTENTGTDASSNPQTIAMTGSARIGLAVASNNAQGGTCFAEFSDVVATGSVSGQFQVADIGTISPGNDPAALYVAVEDSSGKVAVVTNPDTGLVNVLEWTEWKIPLSDLAGVNLSKVKKMYIGVGDRKNPVQDGGGRIYIDDIRVTKP